MISHAVLIILRDSPAPTWPRRLEALETLPRGGGWAQRPEDGLIPHVVQHRRTVEHRLEGYWRDIGTLDSW